MYKTFIINKEENAWFTNKLEYQAPWLGWPLLAMRIKLGEGGNQDSQVFPVRRSLVNFSY